MFMTSAETTKAVFCDRETYRCPRTVLGKDRINVTRSPVRVQARVRSSTREALTTFAVWSSLSRQVIKAWMSETRVLSPPVGSGAQYGTWFVVRAWALSLAG